MQARAEPPEPILGVAFGAVILAVAAFQQFDKWAACLPAEYVAAGSRLMQEYRRASMSRRREIAAWVRQNKSALRHDLGNSVSCWLYCVDHEEGYRTTRAQSVRFCALMRRAQKCEASSADIDSLWAAYFATGDPLAVQLIQNQAICGRDEIIEKVVWSYESVTQKSFDASSFPPLIRERVNKFRVLEALPVISPITQ